MNFEALLLDFHRTKIFSRNDKILQSISVITSAIRLKNQVILNAYTLQCNYLM